ncbi:zinc finger, CCHC-type containing protein [Tanacetum coccineum]
MVVAAMKHMDSNFAKLDKFEGVDFWRWQKKMHFLLSSMSVIYVLTTPIPEDGENAIMEISRERTSGKMMTMFTEKEELTLVELGSHLRIEESLRMQDSDKPRSNNVVGPLVVNMVEHNNGFRYTDNRGKRKHQDTKVDSNNKLKMTCWKCGKPGHLKKDCEGGKVSNNANGLGTNGSVNGSFNSLKGATVHVCKDRCWFKTYESLNDGSILHMGNESTTLVHGRGCVDLKFSSGKIVSLLNIVNDNIGSAFMSTSKLNDSTLWHARLSHVHYKRMQDMSKDELIPSFDMNTKKTESRVLGYKKYFVTFVDEASRTESRVLGIVVRLSESKLKTLGERGIECIFVGYAKHSKAFRFSSTPRPSQRPLINRTKDFGGSVVLEVDKVSGQHSYFFNVEDDPMTFDEAMKSQDVAFWKEAIHDEINSIIGNNTWVLVDLPPGIDYFDTYAPMDVKTTFLNGELGEDVYMNQLKASSCLKMKTSKFDESCKGVIICLYVYDMLIFGTDQVQVDLSKEFLSSRFFVKDMRGADVILVSTPMDTSERLMPNNGHVVSQLHYSKVLEGSTDASWINNTKENLSTSGWVVLLGGGAISWASKKQTCITNSTMEYEFIALTAAGKKAEWLRNLILKIILWSKPIAPISISCDSAATLARSYSQT